MGLKVSSKTTPSVRDILHSPAFVPWKKFQLSKVDVTRVGEEGAVISYRAVASRGVGRSDSKMKSNSSKDEEGEGEEEEEEVGFDALCCSVWRWEGGRWMMCFHQQSMSEALTE